jgi:hypothetical protein
LKEPLLVEIVSAREDDDRQQYIEEKLSVEIRLDDNN